MKVLLISQYFPPEVGATQTRMNEFARHLARLGHTVTVVCEFPNHPHGRIPDQYRGKLFSEDRGGSFRVLRVWVWASPHKNFLNRMLFYVTFSVTASLRALFLPRQDVVLATTPPLFTGVAGYLCSLRHRAPFVLDVRDLWPLAAVALGALKNRRFIRLAERLERFLYRKASRVVVVTRGFGEYVIRSGAGAEKVVHIPNGTIPSLFRPEPPGNQLRRESGMEDRFLVTFAGTQGIAQGLPRVLEAARLCRDDPTIGFALIGDGPVHSRLAAEKERYRLDNVFLRASVPPEQIVAYLNDSDALLVPLRKHPAFDAFIPSKLYDYMACAKPVLLGVDGEARRLLERARAGIHYDPENPEALLSAIRTLRDDPQLRAQLGRRGREFVISRFDRARQAERLNDLLQQLAE